MKTLLKTSSISGKYIVIAILWLGAIHVYAGNLGGNAAGNCGGGACILAMAEGGHEGNTDAGGALRSFAVAPPNNGSPFDGVTEVFAAHTLQREYSKLSFIRRGEFLANKRNAMAINNLAKLYGELQAKFQGLKVSILSAPGEKDTGGSAAFAKQVAMALVKVGVKDVLLDLEPLNPSIPPSPPSKAS
jgi:hypothetical protein